MANSNSRNFLHRSIARHLTHKNLADKIVSWKLNMEKTKMDKITDCLRIAHPPSHNWEFFHTIHIIGVVSMMYLKAGAKIFLQYSIFLYGGEGTNLKWYSGTNKQ